MKKRVAVTGLGCVSPFGRGVNVLMNALLAGESAVKQVPGNYENLGFETMIAGLVPRGLDTGIPRNLRRSMSPMSMYSFLACREALESADISDSDAVSAIDLILGSTMGSPNVLEEFFNSYLGSNSVSSVKSMTFFKVMGHTAAANTAMALGLKGRTLGLAGACAAGSQAIGLGYESIASGKSKMALCGGTDEFHPLTAATFNIINAASRKYNDTPSQTPRPFDRDRDGIVCSEGAGVLLLEELDSALNRGGKVLAEIIGFAMTSDPSGMANPCRDSIGSCLEKALSDAGVKPADIDYVNAHATGTEIGDRAECMAIANVFGKDMEVSSLKGNLGHAMAGSGAIESIAVISAIEKGCILPTKNLLNIDIDCDIVKHVKFVAPKIISCFLKNSFALGGINTSIVFRSHLDE